MNSPNASRVSTMIFTHGVIDTSGPATGFTATAFGKIENIGNRHP